MGANNPISGKDGWGSKLDNEAQKHLGLPGINSTLNPNSGGLFHMPGKYHNIGTMMNPTQIEQEKAANKQANLSARQTRQGAMAQGVGGGGAQAGAEAQAYAGVQSQFAMQQEIARQQKMKQDMQTMFLIFKLFGGGF